ncbi:hypothetical protein [Rhizobium sp. MHM7A]|uniref:hypothetical protein n=1 Tax=Rhizobium sp. MHM7A TaxID=2583233 RepID=UPI001105B72B|nr:hypothetical protein [Rhizobium sp. MHM7A]TLX16968.1 hypothetical protein FFR93_06520 [Rhizobium sp. MHM7A]
MSNSLFRLTVKSDGKVVPAFAPSENATCFEEAYKSFIFENDVQLFADLIEFNQMTFLFAGFDIPGFDPTTHDALSRDIAVSGAVLDDGSISLVDGRVLSVEDLWTSHQLDVPSFNNSFRM